ncbi:nuclear transport factor 2 family protein [Mucilaginibacter sp. OK283]|jgi:predicted SnoaL-like aldol condensation-catalyzing enzyme|uniref:nuclear transport factor 2 family protein n=1 Tax=Mucilaginibacter sp. OK283 TaxID=1881049 RepID=UPI0008CFE153|nr:nuclear transport factor 2 family protein [Mucilaginibacter sp. OK283]SEO80930.1 Predicted SnoaL-like aldol condensation-catalyzing enzyme [Mucilaginibacter sp. OK283]
MKITNLPAMGICCIILCAFGPAKANTPMDTLTNKQKVLSFYKLIVGQRKAELIPEFVLENYKQHNPTVPQGRAGITGMINYLKTLPPPPEGAKSPIVRAIQEGDMVVAHLDIQFMGKRMVVIDLFELENGMLAGHWDAIQEIPDQTGLIITASNGTAEIDAAASAEKSKQVVNAFYQAILHKKMPAELLKADYTEHDPAVTNTGKSLDEYLLNDHNREMKIHRVIAEGDFVMVQSQFKRGGKGFVFYEIFRVEADKIAEHWSVEQAVPEGVEAADMF